MRLGTPPNDYTTRDGFEPELARAIIDGQRYPTAALRTGMTPAEPGTAVRVGTDIAAWVVSAVDEVCYGRADVVHALGPDAAAEYLPLSGSASVRGVPM